MKKLKISLLALVLTAGIGGAVVQKIQAAPRPLDPTYDWNGSGPLKTGVDINRTVTQAQTDYGCSATTNVCATSVLHGTNTPGPSIFKN